MAEPTGVDPDVLLDSLVFDPPDRPLDMPVPPLMQAGEEILVHRSLDLPAALDTRLRAAAAAQGMSVEDYVLTLAEQAA